MLLLFWCCAFINVTHGSEQTSSSVNKILRYDIHYIGKYSSYSIHVINTLSFSQKLWFRNGISICFVDGCDFGVVGNSGICLVWYIIELIYHPSRSLSWWPSAVYNKQPNHAHTQGRVLVLHKPKSTLLGGCGTSLHWRWGIQRTRQFRKIYQQIQLEFAIAWGFGSFY